MNNPHKWKTEVGEGIGCALFLLGVAAVILALGHVGCIGKGGNDRHPSVVQVAPSSTTPHGLVCPM